MYTMKQACEKTGLTYETLKFYCNQGLVPNVKRDSQNRRVFDDLDIAWVNSLNCLRGCNMGIQEMRHYINLVLAGNDTIPERRVILDEKQKALREELARIQSSIDYIDWTQRFYDDVEAGRIPMNFEPLQPKD